jgi:hypothetical protein
MRRGKAGRAQGCGMNRGKERLRMMMETFLLFGWI